MKKKGDLRDFLQEISELKVVAVLMMKRTRETDGDEDC